MSLIIKAYLIIFAMDIIIIAVHLYLGKLRRRREIRQMIEGIFNQKNVKG